MNLRQTTLGPRPDLAALECNWPVDYIGPLLFPISYAREKTGDFTAVTIASESAVQSARNATDALTPVLRSNQSNSYTTVKKEKRYVMSEDEVKEVGGLEVADKICARAAKRSGMRAFEDAVYAKIFTANRKANAVTMGTAGTELAAINWAANLARQGCFRDSGKLSLVCSQQWLLAFLNISAINTYLLSRGVFQATMNEALRMGQGALTNLLSTVLPFQQILVGDDAHFYATGAQNVAAVMVVPDLQGEDAIIKAKSDPIYGVSKWFLPDPVGAPNAPFEIATDWLSAEKLNCWDATASYDLVEINAGMAVCIKLADNSVFSTGSTTTTA